MGSSPNLSRPKPRPVKVGELPSFLRKSQPAKVRLPAKRTIIKPFISKPGKTIPYLPAEIRIKIWEHYLKREPRIFAYTPDANESYQLAPTLSLVSTEANEIVSKFYNHSQTHSYFDPEIDTLYFPNTTPENSLAYFINNNTKTGSSPSKDHVRKVRRIIITPSDYEMTIFAFEEIPGISPPQPHLPNLEHVAIVWLRKDGQNARLTAPIATFTLEDRMFKFGCYGEFRLEMSDYRCAVRRVIEDDTEVDMRERAIMWARLRFIHVGMNVGGWKEGMASVVEKWARPKH